MKQIVIILLTIVLFFGAFYISPNYITGKEYENLSYYVLADNTVKIYDYSGKGSKVTIPETIDGRKVSNIESKSIGFETKNNQKEAIPDFLISGYNGSAAYDYAVREGILFNCLHKFKVENYEKPTYVKKGLKHLVCTCADCGYVKTETVDRLKIPDLKLNEAIADGDKIVLKWNSIDGINKYNIYRSVDNGKAEKISTANENKYNDYTAVSGNLKYYITASAGKNEGTKNISPLSLNYFRPPDFSLDTVKKGISINWNDCENAVKYRVYKKSYDGTFQKIYETDNASSHNYLDKNVKKQSEYFYIVTAVDSSGNESSKSKQGKSLVFGRHTKIACLTFDDGPSENTLKILKVLKKYNAKATFFVTGNDKVKYMKKIVDEGHQIALHTYSHNYKKIYSSTDAYFEDLNKIHDLVLEKTGVDTRVMRFPGGASNTISANYCKGIMSKLTKMVEEKGYRYFDWNVLSGDANGNNIPASTIVRSTKAESKGIDRCVVLMHDTQAKSTTVEALDEICEYYKNNGYEFDSLSTDSAPCHQAVNN